MSMRLLITFCTAVVAAAFVTVPQRHSIPNAEKYRGRIVARHGPLFFYKDFSNDTITLTPEGPPKVSDVLSSMDRFQRLAAQDRHVDQSCIVTIENVRYNLTLWARSHPGGAAILQKFHDKDATKSFFAAHHSVTAVKMLGDFAIIEDDVIDEVINRNTTFHRANTMAVVTHSKESLEPIASATKKNKLPRWRVKLITSEDPFGIHKVLGVFVLLHFAFRFFQMIVTDPSAGLGSRLGKGASWIPVLCLIPHGLLSLSSLIFHTVPRDRVVGKPMIWQEFRVHNIAFGLRSVLTAALCSISIHNGNTASIRRWIVPSSAAVCLAAMIAADAGTNRLRSNRMESTTATMPYWEGCSVATQKRFKSFYAYCQFLATLACLLVTNPAYPLSVLLAIQMASLLMTLVRKGFLSARGYHLGYTAALAAPFVVAFRSMIFSRSFDVIYVFGIGSVLYQLRRHGINKYVIWIPVIVARIAWGDRFLCCTGW